MADRVAARDRKYRVMRRLETKVFAASLVEARLIAQDTPNNEFDVIETAIEEIE